MSELSPLCFQRGHRAGSNTAACTEWGRGSVIKHRAEIVRMSNQPNHQVLL
jgi:hypothetical protein